MRKIAIIILLIILLESNTFAFYENNDEDNNEIEVIATIKINNPIRLNAKNAILYDNTYDQILFEKDAYVRVPNASTTKILTAIVAYENGDMESVVTVSKKAAMIGGSVINLRINDKVKLGDLVKGLLVRSGNDAAIAIAEHVGGSVENFCQMMNEKAIEMNLKNTNFVTPHGLDNENHYSTAYDLVKMSEYLLDIKYLSDIVSENSVTIKINNNTMILNTTNEMLNFYKGTDGVKTGFTGKAGRCLITSVSRNGRQLISVVLGCDTKRQRTEDSIKILNYGFENFDVIDICENMKKEHEIQVDKGKSSKYSIIVNEEVKMPILKENKEKITYKYNFFENLRAPVMKNQKIGEIYIFIDRKNVKKIDINLPETIEKKGILDYFYEISFNELKKYEIRL